MKPQVTAGENEIAVDADDATLQYQRIASQLREDIVEGVWPQDSRLKVRDLSAHYGIGIGPVREALQQLQGEGLIVLEPNRGARVRPIDENMLINIFDVREALESFLTEKFARAASPHQISVLRAIQAEHDVAVDAMDPAAAFDLNRRFHVFINSAVRNPEAVAVINRHLDLSRALRREYGLSTARLRDVQKDHHMLIDAIARGDHDAARRISAAHVRSSRDDLLEKMQMRRKGS